MAAEAGGAEGLRGSLADLEALRAGAAQADGVIHPAFGDFRQPGRLGQAVAEESAAIAALAEELVGSDRPFVTVSGSPWVPGPGLHRDRPAAHQRAGRRSSRTVTAVLGLGAVGIGRALRRPERKS
jgi:hypothetical protein